MVEKDKREPQTPGESIGEMENEAPTDPEEVSVHPRKGTIPVVGLGGSAGSLAPLSSIVARIPEHSGAAYVIVVHLSPDYEYMLPEILQRETSLPVRQVEGRATLEKDHIYVISPGKQLCIYDGILESVDLDRPKGRHATIDVFFRTLAAAHGANSCAIVLSGVDGDGALGLKRVKERGGLTIAQDPAEAESDGMPSFAITTGMVDWILPANEIPARLVEYWSNGRNLRLPMPDDPEPSETETLPATTDESSLKEVLNHLKALSGHDFGNYKRATVLRRVGRRMQVNGTPTLDEYLAYLRTHPGESGALLQDLLISVTNFFRDSSSFRVFEAIIPSLFKDKNASSQIRVWVTACASGEEAYSIAMLLCEHAEKLKHPPSIQVFATDLDQNAIAIAREGRYPHAIAADVSEERLKRFFTAEAGGYRTNQGLRQTILFAVHDILQDPPFSRLDLVSCRNFLIYLNREAQNKVADIFHFALRPHGKLILGAAESVEEVTGLFEAIDKKHRIYVRKEGVRIGLPLPSGSGLPTSSTSGLSGFPQSFPVLDREERHVEPPRIKTGLAELHLGLIERFALPSVVVNRAHDVVHVSKRAGKYLRISGGEPSASLLKLIHPDLRSALRLLLFQSTNTKSAVKSQSLPVDTGEKTESVVIRVEAVDPETREFFLVIFEDQGVKALPDDQVLEVAPKEQSLVRLLEAELDEMRSTYRETVEDYKASVEELKASNEELQSMNEEMCSATEELETGREELQSINEEVITINQELKGKVEELGRANSDLQNLMASTKIATIFLDRNLRIKFFTPSSVELFNFIPGDQGRPLSDLNRNLVYKRITQDAMEVLEKLTMIEREVKNTEGNWLLVRLSPYRSAEDENGGVVITCTDITERKKNQESHRWLSSIVEFSNDAVISFTPEGDIISWNKGAERIFGYTADEIIGKSQSILAPESLQGEKKELLGRLQRGEVIDPFETVRICRDGLLIDVSLSASVIRDDSGEIVGATAIAQDISARKQAVEDLKRARDGLEERVKERTAELRKRVSELANMASQLTFAEERERKRLARILHDEFQQMLVSAKMNLQTLDGLDEEARNREVKSLTKLMDDLIASSRSLSIELSPHVLSETLGRALEWLCLTWMPEKHNLRVHSNIDQSLDSRSEDIRSIVFYSVRELLFNVVKHSQEDEAYVNLAPHGDGDLKVTVHDHGLGFDPEAERSKSGDPTGFGLIGLRERLEMLGGKFTIRSQPGDGVEAVIIVPRKTNENE